MRGYKIIIRTLFCVSSKCMKVRRVNKSLAASPNSQVGTSGAVASTTCRQCRATDLFIAHSMYDTVLVTLR